MDYFNDLYKDWLGAFQAIGTPAISRDTAARILAVTCVFGSNEALVYSKKYVAEIDHIKQMYHIDGGETPDGKIAPLIKEYVNELESDRQPTEWARQLFQSRYGIKLIN